MQIYKEVETLENSDCAHSSLQRGESNRNFRRAQKHARTLVRVVFDINAPINKVWKAFSQLEKWPKYCDCIKKAYWTSPKKWSLNSTFTQVIKIGILKRVSHPRIIKIKKARYVTWTGTGSLVQGVHALIFEKINNNKTKVINREYFKGILAQIIFPFIKSKFEEYFGQFLNGLKKESEK